MNGVNMNANHHHHHASGFHVKAPSVVLEPGPDPLSEAPLQVQGLSFVSGREHYGLPSHGQLHHFHMSPPFNREQLNPEQPSHPCQDGVTSCLHGDSHSVFGGGHQNTFQSEFRLFTETKGQDCIAQQHQRRQPAMPDYGHHGHPDTCHAVPAPCLPLDQSPNRAASFHGFPSSSSSSPSSETTRLEHCRLFPQGRVGGLPYCFPCDPQSGRLDVVGLSTPDSTASQKFSYFEAGGQMAGANFHTFDRSSFSRSAPPAVRGSKVDQQQLPQQNAYCGRVGDNRGPKMELGVSSRHHLMAASRLNPFSSGLSYPYHAADFISNSPDVLQNGSVSLHNQHSQLDNHIHRLNGHSVHPFDEPAFGVPLHGPCPPTQQQHFSNSFSYQNIAKRPRYDLANSSTGENCTGLHHWPGLESHGSSSTFPDCGVDRDFAAHVTHCFPSDPADGKICSPHQQPLPHLSNAAMMIKQMACRNQQQRMKQAEMQPLSHNGDVTPNRAQQVNASHFDRRHHFLGNFDAPSPHLPPENCWFPGLHQQCRDPHGHAMEQNGHTATFRLGPTNMDVQCLNSPGLRNSCENIINGNPLQVHQLDDGTMQPNTVMERSKSDFGVLPVRRQHSFPPGGPNQQGKLPQNNQCALRSYSSDPKYNQQLSINKLGALSLGNLNKTSPKDSVYGQSCLAALSTACQNMIASLGAPNLNVTFNKKSQNEAKRKPGQVEQDINSSSSSSSGGSGGTCGPGLECFQSSASQNSHTPCPGNNNNATGGQSVVGNMAKQEPNALSPNNGADSGSEGRVATGSGRGRGKRRHDSGHISPGNSMVSPVQQGRTPETCLVSPRSSSFGKADLATSMDSGIQSVGKSDGVSPCMDFLDDASPNYCGEDSAARISRNGAKCGMDARGGYLEQVKTPLVSSGQDEVHPLEILQAQIQLQRQQFSISEDQPCTKPQCQSGINGDCTLANCSPNPGRNSTNVVDLNSLMTERHSHWYSHGNKCLEPGNSKCRGFWDGARCQSDNIEGHG